MSILDEPNDSYRNNGLLKKCMAVRPGTLGRQSCLKPAGHADRHTSQDHQSWTDDGARVPTLWRVADAHSSVIVEGSSPGGACETAYDAGYFDVDCVELLTAKLHTGSEEAQVQ